MLSEAVTQNPTLTQSLIDTARSAFTVYTSNKLVQAVPLSVAGAVKDGSFEYFDRVIAVVEGDPGRAKQARDKDEKFGLYLNSLSRAKAAIETAQNRLSAHDIGNEAVSQLVDGVGDILGPYLGEKVGLLSGRQLSS